MMKQQIPVAIAALTGLVLIVLGFIRGTETWEGVVLDWFNTLAAVAMILGGASLVKNHLQKLSARRPGWGYAAVTLIAFFVTLFVGLAKVGVQPTTTFPNHPWADEPTQEGSTFWWLFWYIYSPLQSAMFSLLAFYVTSAAFRAFRAKSPEAAILLATAIIVLLGKTYAGVFISEPLVAALGPDWSSLRLDRLVQEVFLSVFNSAGTRAITIGIALGVAATSLKVLLGFDRSYLG